MKIHDKFVIELAEVIKAYGNDYRVEEPFHLPCDYKFYEISGVAICEESFKKMKRLEDEIKAVIDKIRAEIDEISLSEPIVSADGLYCYGSKSISIGSFRGKVLDIIDKYLEGEVNRETDN